LIVASSSYPQLALWARRISPALLAYSHVYFLACSIGVYTAINKAQINKIFSAQLKIVSCYKPFGHRLFSSVELGDLT